jgi:diguanylate cyclase (GGDEF)-like protein/putative nucleotidyltransferase with HDIG domain
LPLVLGQEIESMNQQRPRGVRPVLLLVVYGVFLVVVGVTATLQTGLLSLHFSAAAMNATVAADAAIVRTFANGELTESDLEPSSGSPEPDPERAARLEADLAALATRAGLERIDIRSPSGAVLLSTQPGARGSVVPAGGAFAEAAGGTTTAGIVDAGEPTGAASGAIAEHPVLRAYLPLIDANGSTDAIAAVWRNAAPIVGALGHVQEQMLAVTLVAAGVAALVLYLVFRGAHVRIARQTVELLEATRRDPLTGLLNHGAMAAELTAAVERSRSDRGAVGIALIDLDNFRLLNETHGHAAGDDALLRLARLVELHRPSRATTGRFGPDEFLVIAPAAAIAALRPAIEQLRHALVDESLQFEASERLPITISVGIATSPSDADSATELLSVATRVLGEARASGGDAVRVAGQGPARSRDAQAFSVLQSLVFAIDTKDRYTKRHSEDVSRYSVFLARRLELDAPLVEAIRVAGLLHDIGKVGIPEDILRKPGRLTAAEYDIVKQHVALGDAIVRDLVRQDLVRLGIRHHHERWDGDGYLDGLGGEEIPLVARVLAVGDAFSAMTTTRPYRKALTVEEALRRLTDAASSQLDEDLVVTFVRGMEEASDAPLPGAEAGPALWLPGARVA